MDSYHIISPVSKAREYFLYDQLKYTRYLDFCLSNSKLYFFLFKTHRYENKMKRFYETKRNIAYDTKITFPRTFFKYTIQVQNIIHWDTHLTTMEFDLVAAIDSTSRSHRRQARWETPSTVPPKFQASQKQEQLITESMTTAAAAPQTPAAAAPGTRARRQCTEAHWVRSIRKRRGRRKGQSTDGPGRGSSDLLWGWGEG